MGAVGGGAFPPLPVTAGCLCRAGSIQLNHLRSHTLSEQGSGVPGARICLAARPAPGWASSPMTTGAGGKPREPRAGDKPPPVLPSPVAMAALLPLAFCSECLRCCQLLRGGHRRAGWASSARAWESECAEPPNRSAVCCHWGDLSIQQQAGAGGWQDSVLYLRPDSSFPDKAEDRAVLAPGKGSATTRVLRPRAPLSPLSSRCLGLLPAQSQTCV